MAEADVEMRDSHHDGLLFVSLIPQSTSRCVTSRISILFILKAAGVFDNVRRRDFKVWWRWWTWMVEKVGSKLRISSRIRKLSDRPIDFSGEGREHQN